MIRLAVVKHQGKYRVELYQSGKKVYRKSGFETELEAKIHEKEVLENLEAIDMGFLRLCDSHLEELDLKRSQQHFNENLTLIKQDLIPRWGRKKLVTRDDVEAYLNEIAKESKSKANKRLRLIKALFGHGVKGAGSPRTLAWGSTGFRRKKPSATFRRRKTSDWFSNWPSAGTDGIS
jgi:hypothetical protein